MPQPASVFPHQLRPGDIVTDGEDLRQRPLREFLRERYHEHLLPHDVEHRLDDLGLGTTRLEILRTLNVRPCRVLSMRKLEDGITAVRHLLPRCYFDRDKTRGLWRALEITRQGRTLSVRRISSPPPWK
jgi:hypothetical protein